MNKRLYFTPDETWGSGHDLVPVEEDGKTVLSVHLRERPAALLALGAGIKKPLEESGLEMRITKLVAGAHNHRELTLQVVI